MNKHMPLYYGWYDGPSNSNGNVVLSYWNHIVNSYPTGNVYGESPNDPSRYTKENYVNAVRHYISEHHKINPTRKFIIDLPVAEVWWDGQRIASDGYRENIPVWKTLEWIKYVVTELEDISSIVGWYQADEPEVWGYREVINGNPANENPPIEYHFLKNRYDLISSISTKPVIAVFCDVPLYKERYERHIYKYGTFFDVFGFDHYPYLANGTNLPLLKIKQFVKLAYRIDQDMPIMFVGQSSGTEKFNTRQPSLKEHEDLYTEWTKNCPPSKRFGYLLWSFSYGTEESNRIGNFVLGSNILTTWDWYNKSILGKLFYYIKTLLNL